MPNFSTMSDEELRQLAAGTAEFEEIKEPQAVTDFELPDMSELSVEQLEAVAAGQAPLQPPPPEEAKEKTEIDRLKDEIKSGKREVSGYTPVNPDDSATTKVLKNLYNTSYAALIGAGRIIYLDFLDELSALGDTAIAQVATAITGAPEDQQKEFWEAYKERRNIQRALQDISFEEETAASVVGMLGGAALLPGVSAATPTKIAIPLIAAEGMVAGLGTSQAELLDGEYGKALRDMAEQGTVDVALGGAFHALGKTFLQSTRKMDSATKRELEKTLVEDVEAGVAESARDRYMSNLPSEQALVDVVSDPDAFKAVTSYRRWRSMTTPQQRSAIKGVVPRNEWENALNPDSAAYAAVRQEMRNRNVPKTQLEDFVSFRIHRNEQLAVARYMLDSTLSSTRNLTPTKLLKRAAVVAEREGPDYVKRSAVRSRVQKHAFEELAQRTGRESVRFTGKKGTAADTFSRFLMDAKYVYRNIDRKFGTELEPLLDQASNQYNKFTFLMRHATRRKKALNKALRRSKMTPEELGRWVGRADATEKLKGAQLRAVQEWRKGFEEMRQLANEVGLPIPKLTDKATGKAIPYVPQRALGPVDYLRAFAKRSEELDVADAPWTYFSRRTGDPEYQEFRRALEHVWGPLKNKDELMAAIEGLKDVEAVKARLTTAATASFKRGREDMPDWIQEHNISRLWDSWTHNTFRHAMMRDIMQDMRGWAAVVRKTDRAAAKYIVDHVADVSGVRTGTLAAKSQAARIKFQVKMDELADQAGPLGRKFFTGAKELPEFMDFAYSQIYPNLLGLNPKALIRNLLQPFVMTAPEVSGAGLRPGGAAWSQGLALRAQLDAVRDYIMWGKRGSVEALETLRERGLVPDKFTGEAINAVERGMKDALPVRLSKAGLRAQAELAMLPYVKSDLHNRIVTLKMSQYLADDLTKMIRKEGDINENVLQFAKSIPPGYKSRLRNAILTDAPRRQVENILADYLLSTTQYNYNRVAMGEYGRTMGGLFSMFSKWPQSIAGRTADRLREHGVPKGTLKILTETLGPVLALGTVGSLVMPDVQESDAAKKLIGSRGLAAWAPGQSLRDLGEISSPPMIDVFVDAYDAAQEADPRAAERWLSKQLKTFTPGGAWYRFMFDDIPTIAKDKRPDDFWEGFDFYRR